MLLFFTSAASLIRSGRSLHWTCGSLWVCKYHAGFLRAQLRERTFAAQLTTQFADQRTTPQQKKKRSVFVDLKHKVFCGIRDHTGAAEEAKVEPELDARPQLCLMPLWSRPPAPLLCSPPPPADPTHANLCAWSAFSPGGQLYPTSQLAFPRPEFWGSAFAQTQRQTDRLTKVCFIFSCVCLPPAPALSTSVGRLFSAARPDHISKTFFPSLMFRSSDPALPCSVPGWSFSLCFREGFIGLFPPHRCCFVRYESRTE